MGCERGSATLIAIFIMVLLGSLGISLLLLSKSNIQIATNQRDGVAAQYLAEAGVQWAVVRLKSDHEFVEITEQTIEQFTSPSLITGIFRVQIGPDLTTHNIQKRLITANAIVNKAERQVVATITLPNPTGGIEEVFVIWNH